MCLWTAGFVKTPMVVGDKLEAGIYAKEDDGTPIKGKVYLDGFNPETKKWLTFAETVPDQKIGWAGMPFVPITDEMVGTWRMSWSAPGSSCGAQSNDLVVTKVATPIYLSSDKSSIQKGDSVMFSGKYKPGEPVNIFETGIVRNHITQVKCDSSGNFKVLVAQLNLDEGLRQIQACSAGGLGIYECSLFPDKSAFVYITIHPRQTCNPQWHCIDPFNGIESDDCGHTRPNAGCNPQDPGGTGKTGEKPCTDGDTKSVLCPDDPAKTKTMTCVEGSWVTTKDECGISTETMILAAVVVIVFLMILSGGKK